MSGPQTSHDILKIITKVLILQKPLYIFQLLLYIFVPASPAQFTYTYSAHSAAYWWVVTTMTTVGYGDFYPVTLPGYIYGGIMMIKGTMLTALPVAIIGGNYAILYEHNQKREKRKQREEMRRLELKECKVTDNSSPAEKKVRRSSTCCPNLNKIGTEDSSSTKSF